MLYCQATVAISLAISIWSIIVSEIAYQSDGTVIINEWFRALLNIVPFGLSVMLKCLKAIYLYIY